MCRVKLGWPSLSSTFERLLIGTKRCWKLTFFLRCHIFLCCFVLGIWMSNTSIKMIFTFKSFSLRMFAYFCIYWLLLILLAEIVTPDIWHYCLSCSVLREGHRSGRKSIQYVRKQDQLDIALWHNFNIVGVVYPMPLPHSWIAYAQHELSWMMGKMCRSIDGL